jgi:pimeloyl-ACP methyl ester carboxylesterase
VTLSVVTWGDRADPPVVLLHCLAGDAGDWAVVAAALAADRRWVVAPDMRGHGASGRTPGYSLDLMRADVLALADALGIERFDLVGHSMGGSVAVLVAEAAPHRLSRLVLEDTAPATGKREFPVPPAEAPEEVPFDWPMLQAVIAELNDPDPRAWDELPRITAPVLVVGGGATSANDQGELAELAARVPDGRVVTIDVGHHVHTTAPEEYLAAVRPFLTPPASE